MARKQTMKVYHGIPKSITDEHTIFYASFDGTCNPKIGSMLKGANNLYYKPSPTGLAQYYTTSSAEIIKYKLNETLSIYTGFTIDFWINISEFRNVANMTYPEVMTFENADGSRSMKIYVSGTNKHIYIEINNSTWYDGVAITPKFDTLPDNCHIRLTSDGTSFKTYCNGVNVSTYAVKTSNNHRSFESVTLHPYRLYSDLCISNINRGVYFPNLPQDFIEGKAIIRPKFGQQQIKGDPMYSQVTNVKIDTQKSSDWVNVSDGYVQNINNPEVTLNDGGFPSGSKIKIKGLNGEIISGVIDTDTALAKVVSYTQNTKKIIVDDTSKLSVGDTVQFLNSELALSNSARTINEINGNEITLHAELTVSGATYVVETTASSSSPIVKTADGTTVVGTWSGLGTNEATFTLGTNTSISGKDLYIEYALTMPYGNSDFPELPYSIEKAWGENGVEMKPVSNIVITDDFKDKIMGSNIKCPHFMGWHFGSSLMTPSTFTENDSQATYDAINKQDGWCRMGTTSYPNQIPQQIFKFNVIEMIERKLGCEIPSNNKVAWVRSNLSQYTFQWAGYGSCHTGNYAEIQLYNPKTSAYVSWTGKSHTSSTPNTITFGTGAISNSDIIDDNGYAYCIAFTKASNGSVYSSIHTDYIALEIKLAVDSTYTTLYCENTRAREDKCNPILIQKETKTVKRYLPSKECFTTECKYVSMDREVLAIKELFNYHHKGVKVYSTTRGSGEYNRYTEIYPNIINLLKIADYNAHTYSNEGLKDSPVTSRVRMSLTEQLGESYGENTLSGMPTEYYDSPKYIQIVPYTRLNNGEIELMLYTSELVDNTDSVILYPKKMTKEYALAYKIPNRPLIK